MTFIELKKRAATRLNLLNSEGNFLLNRDITETIIGDTINEALKEVNINLSNQFPALYEIEAFSDNYYYSSNIATTSTTYLTVTGNIFSTAAEGLYLYNLATEDSVEISQVLNTTDIVLVSAPSGWTVGDGVAIIEKEYIFTSSATDIINVLSIKGKYAQTDEYLPFEQNLYDFYNSDNYSEESPMYRLKQVNNNGVLVQGFEVLPVPTVPITKAFRMRYKQVRTEMVADTDTSGLPNGFDDFLYWKAVIYGAIQRKDELLRKQAEKGYEIGLQALLQMYKPTTDFKVEKKINKHYIDILRRNR